MDVGQFLDDTHNHSYLVEHEPIGCRDEVTYDMNKDSPAVHTVEKRRYETMLTTAVLLLRSSLFLSLHLAGNAGSFPKPLSAEEEQVYLARCAQGDLEARNVLVERNMRLVAHIIKKYYTQTIDQDDLISIGTIGPVSYTHLTLPTICSV